MAIKKFNRKEHDPDYFSKTQQKNEALALKLFGMELVELSAVKMTQLPISEVTLKSLLDYQKITTNLARKRHLMFIGKCLRQENEDAIREYLASQLNNELKKKAEKELEDKNASNSIIEQLIEFGDSKTEELVSQYPRMERQTLKQILRSIHKAKDAQKKRQATDKLKNYLSQHLSLLGIS